MKNIIDITSKQSKFTSVEEQQKNYWKSVFILRDLLIKKNLISVEEIEEWLRLYPVPWINMFPPIFITIKATNSLGYAITKVIENKEVKETNWLPTIVGNTMTYDIYEAICQM